MNILSIFVRHGSTKYPRALDDLRAFQRTHLTSGRRDLLVVDNALGHGYVGRAADHEVVGGSNRHWEFSGWDEGVRHLGTKVNDYDFIHLVTSAYNGLYTRFIDRIDTRALELAAGRRVAIGHIDFYDEAIEVLGHRSQHWLRTSFVFIPPAELAALASLAIVRDPTAFFSGDPSDPFKPDAPLSPNYRRYLIDWLTGPGTGQGTEWHSRFRLTKATLPTFEGKVLAILNEHMLSVRLRRQGGAVVDATWLASRAKRRWRSTLPAEIPSWREQLARRDADAVRPPQPKRSLWRRLTSAERSPD